MVTGFCVLAFLCASSATLVRARSGLLTASGEPASQRVVYQLPADRARLLITPVATSSAAADNAAAGETPAEDFLIANLFDPAGLQTALASLATASPARCAADKASSALAPDEAAPPIDAIVIGALVPLSQPRAAAQGAEMQAALEIAASEINESSGVPVELRIRDTQGLAEVGQQAARELIEQECAVGLVGVYHDEVALAVAEVAHEHHVPLIVVRAGSNALLSTERPEVFRIGPSVNVVQANYRGWLATIMEAQRTEQGELPQALLISTTQPLFQARTELFTSWLSEMKVKVHSFDVDAGQQNFESLMARVVTLPQRPQLVLLNVDRQALLPLQGALASAGLTPQRSTTVSVSVGPLERDIWRSSSRVDGMIAFYMGPWQTVANPLALHFAQHYREQVEQTQVEQSPSEEAENDLWPPAYAFQSYDALYLLVNAIAQAESLDGDALIGALEATDIELTAGRYFFPSLDGAQVGATEAASTNLLPPAYHQWPDLPLYFVQIRSNGETVEPSIIWPPPPLPTANTSGGLLD